MTELPITKQRLQQTNQKITQAAEKVGRKPNSICLIAVSKGQSIEKIKEAYEAGQKDFGENYVQELIEKTTAQKVPGVYSWHLLQWHFLGHLQKNKINKVVPLIQWLHSLDSLELAQAIHQRAQKPLKCLLEIKLGEETTKTGLSPKTALEIIPQLRTLTNIDLRGLMTIPPLGKDPQDSRPYFQKLSLLLKEINQRYLYTKPLTELSMGMSDDFEIAIEEGATMVRIGRAIFGERM